MSSSEEFSDSSTEGYLSDDSECLDFQEIETEERANQELPSESSTSDQETDSELQAYTDEPLADEEWLKNYRQQQEEKSNQEEVLAPKSSYGEIFFISPLELVDDKVLTPKMKKKWGSLTLFRRKWQWKNALISINWS